MMIGEMYRFYRDPIIGRSLTISAKKRLNSEEERDPQILIHLDKPMRMHTLS